MQQYGFVMYHDTVVHAIRNLFELYVHYPLPEPISFKRQSNRMQKRNVHSTVEPKDPNSGLYCR